MTSVLCLVTLAACAEGLVPPARHARPAARPAAPRTQTNGSSAGPTAAMVPDLVGATTSLTTAYEFSGSYTSLYATLGLYVLSFPGLYSLIKRATKVQLVQKTFEFGPESALQGMTPVATEVMAYMKANNYDVADAGEVITFKGKIEASKSQAVFLSFCTFIGLASLSLVLQIQFPAIGAYWFLGTLFSPFAGFYYWQNAVEDNEFKVKLEANDNESVTNLTVLGGKEDVERMARVMDFREQGMVRVKGLFEDSLN